MPEGSSILRETGCHLKNQPLHRSRLRTNDFSVKTRCRSGFARREIFRSGKACARSCAPMIFHQDKMPIQLRAARDFFLNQGVHPFLCADDFPPRQDADPASRGERFVLNQGVRPFLCADDFSVKARRKGAGVSCIRQARSNAALAEKARRFYSFSKIAFMPRYVI